MDSATSRKSSDDIQSHINGSIHQTRQLVNSWLPRTEPIVIDQQKDEFHPAPPRLGLGATFPENQNMKKSHTSKESLRRVLVGSNRHQSKLKHKVVIQQSNKQRTVMSQEESDDDIGRSSLGNLKRKKTTARQHEERNQNQGDVVAKGQFTNPGKKKKI